MASNLYLRHIIAILKLFIFLKYESNKNMWKMAIKNKAPIKCKVAKFCKEDLRKEEN